jgi:UDP-N-acetylmuramoyl-L-alanyl-D-glutamate--2,6-diaminopimelate ligase
MNLKKLLTGIPLAVVKGSKDIEVKSLCNNSQAASPGSLFFAKKGNQTDGHKFITGAISAGSVAIATDLFDPFLKGVSQIIHPDVKALEALIARKFYGNPSSKLLLVGITGTNGKTTCSYLIKHLLDFFGKEAGLVGTIESVIKNEKRPSSRTTADVLTNQKLLHEMVQEGCSSAVMEVSSHGLDQSRVSGIDFDVAVFTNLTKDHLDYHSSMEAYAAAKAKLFSSLENGKKKGLRSAVINQDSPFASLMMQNVKGPILTYGLLQTADLRAEDIELSPAGISCIICYKEKRYPFVSSLVGEFNVYNALAALGTALVVGMDLGLAIKALESFAGVAGRLERVETVSGKNVFVDYAHTGDALQNSLQALRKISKGKVFCVFGCGGERDRSKRPEMGAIAESLCDEVFVTSDNPRKESPEAIIEEILKGIKEVKNIKVEVDRKEAIKGAIARLQKDDVLLIAGKGHEDYQVFGDYTIHFDDRIIAKEYCR